MSNYNTSHLLLKPTNNALEEIFTESKDKNIVKIPSISDFIGFNGYSAYKEILTKPILEELRILHNKENYKFGALQVQNYYLHFLNVEEEGWRTEYFNFAITPEICFSNDKIRRNPERNLLLPIKQDSIILLKNDKIAQISHILSKNRITIHVGGKAKNILVKSIKAIALGYCNMS